jgi:hypothetical protein
VISQRVRREAMQCVGDLADDFQGNNMINHPPIGRRLSVSSRFRFKSSLLHIRMLCNTCNAKSAVYKELLLTYLVSSRQLGVILNVEVCLFGLYHAKVHQSVLAWPWGNHHQTVRRLQLAPLKVCFYVKFIADTSQDDYKTY